jgi:hypothetical protein
VDRPPNEAVDRCVFPFRVGDRVEIARRTWRIRGVGTVQIIKWPTRPDQMHSCRRENLQSPPATAAPQFRVLGQGPRETRKSDPVQDKRRASRA